MSLLWMSHVTLKNESLHTGMIECLDLQNSESKDTMLESGALTCFPILGCKVRQGDMTRSHGRRDLFVRVTWCETWLRHLCDMTHLYVWNNSFICVIWLIRMWLTRMCDMTHSHVCNDTFTRVTWLIDMCDMTHSYLWRDSYKSRTWLNHICDMTHQTKKNPHVWHDDYDLLHPCVTWLIHVCDMAHLYLWRDSFIWLTWLIYVKWLFLMYNRCQKFHICNMTHHTKKSTCVTWLILTGLIHVCDMTHSCVWHDSLICVTWLIYICDMTKILESVIGVVHHTVTYDWVMSHINFSPSRHDEYRRCVCLHVCRFHILHACRFHILHACRFHILHADEYTYTHGTHVYMYACVPWLIHAWGMTHPFVRHDSFICVTWIVHMYNRR